MTPRNRAGHWILLLLCFVSSAQARSTSDDDDLESLSSLAGRALLHSRAYRFLGELADGIGPRLTGSPEEAKAFEWALRTMEAIGLIKVHKEPWQLTRSWRRVSARAELVSPFHLQLSIASLGWTGSTRKGGIEADIVAIDSDSLTDEVKKNASRWSGKILILAGRGAQHLGQVEYLSKLPPFLEAAQTAKALAVIVEDPRPGTMLPHTGPPSFSGVNALFTIPVLDMAAEQRKQLVRLLDRGQKVRVNLDIQNLLSRTPVESANIVGEVPGSEHPEQIVILGAHLDSWDLGTGALDDGFGIAAVLGAADAIIASGLKPRRTIRIVLFSGEEQGLLGSRAYVRAHQSEIPNLVCALALDWGHGPITGMPLAGHTEMSLPLKRFADEVAGIGTLKIDNSYLSYTDAYAFTLAGVPGIAFLQNSHDYSLFGHSAADTLDKVDPEILTRDAALAAQAAFWIANQPTRVGKVFDALETARVLTQDKQRPNLEALGLWPF